MVKKSHSLSASEFDDPERRRWWTSVMLNSYGMTCKLGTSGLGDGFVEECELGVLLALEVKMTNQRIAPTLRDSSFWNGDHLFLKVVKHGSMAIEQNGKKLNFGPNSLFITDPLHPYLSIFDTTTSFVMLRMSRESLRVRGLPYNFPEVIGGDSSSPDVSAVRDFILLLVRKGSSISRELGVRMSQHCMDLMDVVLGEGSRSGRRRTGASALAIRAKQVITRLARNSDLDVAWIARELNVSPNYLTRAFKTTGQTPMRYLMSVRLELAGKLLIEQNSRVKEIAFQCGFSSASHFCSVFKREFGSSPLEFAFSRRPDVRRCEEASDPTSVSCE